MAQAKAPPTARRTSWPPPPAPFPPRTGRALQRAADTKTASGSQKTAADNPTPAGGNTGGAFDLFAGLTIHSAAADTKAAKPEGIEVKMGAFEATTAQVKKLWTTDLQNCMAVIAHDPSNGAAAMTHYNSSGLISGTDITTENPDKIRAQLVALKQMLLKKLSASNPGKVQFRVVLGMVWGWSSGVLQKKFGGLVEEAFGVKEPPIGMTATFDATTGALDASASAA